MEDDDAAEAAAAQRLFWRFAAATPTRPLDDRTRQLLLSWLDHRRNQQTALEVGPINSFHAP